MSNKTLALILGVVAAVLVIGFVVFSSSDSEDASNEGDATSETVQEVDNDTPENEQTTPESPDPESFTLAEVQQHNTSEDCWTIVDSGVYDITRYIPTHPGGDEILRACGADGTTLFQSRTTSDGETVGSGTPHSSNATNQLDGFFIGTLAQ